MHIKQNVHEIVYGINIILIVPSTDNFIDIYNIFSIYCSLSMCQYNK